MDFYFYKWVLELEYESPRGFIPAQGFVSSGLSLGRWLHSALVNDQVKNSSISLDS